MDKMSKQEIWFNDCYKVVRKNIVYQRRKDLTGAIVPGPGLFYSKELFDSINVFDDQTGLI